MNNKDQSLLGKVKSAIGKKTDPMHGVSQMLDRYWNAAYMARSEIDWRWFQYDLWYNGNHYARWDKNTQQIISTNPRSDSRPKVTVNKVMSTVRGVRSHILQNDPVAQVTPYNMSDQDVDQAMYLNRYLMYLHERLHLRSQLRASMLHALKYSVGWWQIMWDEEAEDGQGGIVVNVIDPYDLYIDPNARLPKEARYMILAVRRNIDDLKEDPKYKGADWDSIVGTDNLAASTLKSRILQFERGSYTFNDGKEDHGSVILKEYWYKDGDKIMLSAKIGDEIVRKPEDTGLDRLPFFRLCSDIEPLSMYGQGWVKNLIPLNKALEMNEASVMEYNVVVNKGRYSAPKNAGIKTITNQHGIIVEHKAGIEITPLEIPPLSPVIETQIERFNRYIEDIGCLHDASLGRVPTGVKSGIGVETLQEGDSNNLSELSENTEEFLEDCYEYMLYLLSQKLVLARNVITATETGQKVFFKVIGEQAEDDLKQQQQQQSSAQTEDPTQPQVGGTIVVPSKLAVSVQIANYLAYTSDGRQQAIQQLAAMPQMQSLPPDVILKAYNIGPIADIVKAMKENEQQQAQAQMQQQAQMQDQQHQQAMQQSAQQAQLQQQSQMQQAQQQQQQAAQQAQMQQLQAQANTPPDLGVQQAISFIRQLINAVDNDAPLPKVPKKPSPQFFQYLTEFANSPEGQANPEIAQAIEVIRDHAMLQSQQQGGQKPMAS